MREFSFLITMFENISIPSSDVNIHCTAFCTAIHKQNSNFTSYDQIHHKLSITSYIQILSTYSQLYSVHLHPIMKLYGYRNIMTNKMNTFQSELFPYYLTILLSEFSKYYKNMSLKILFPQIQQTQDFHKQHYMFSVSVIDIRQSEGCYYIHQCYMYLKIDNENQDWTCQQCPNISPPRNDSSLIVSHHAIAISSSLF